MEIKQIFLSMMILSSMTITSTIIGTDLTLQIKQARIDLEQAIANFVTINPQQNSLTPEIIEQTKKILEQAQNTLANLIKPTPDNAPTPLSAPAFFTNITPDKAPIPLSAPTFLINTTPDNAPIPLSAPTFSQAIDLQIIINKTPQEKARIRALQYRAINTDQISADKAAADKAAADAIENLDGDAQAQAIAEKEAADKAAALQLIINKTPQEKARIKALQYRAINTDQISADKAAADKAAADAIENLDGDAQAQAIAEKEAADKAAALQLIINKTPQEKARIKALQYR
ncbi:hypothetical protein KBC04_04745, partial [Candidatus Babeliales bacterium]|nr:hypothetical protein [Candidatus Babeliales bacterium]